MTDKITISVEPLLVDRKTASAVLGVSERSFISAENTGKIGPQPVKLAGNRILYSLKSLREWVDAGLPSRSEWLEGQR